MVPSESWIEARGSYVAMAIYLFADGLAIKVNARVSKRRVSMMVDGVKLGLK